MKLLSIKTVLALSLLILIAFRIHYWEGAFIFGIVLFYKKEKSFDSFKLSCDSFKLKILF